VVRECGGGGEEKDDTRRESGFDEGFFWEGMLERIIVLSYPFVLLVVSGRTGGYGDLGERVRCVFMGGRDLEPSRTHREQKFDLSDDSISAFRFLSSVNGPFQKNKGSPPFSPTESAHYGHPLSSMLTNTS